MESQLAAISCSQSGNRYGAVITTRSDGALIELNSANCAALIEGGCSGAGSRVPNTIEENRGEAQGIVLNRNHMSLPNCIVHAARHNSDLVEPDCLNHVCVTGQAMERLGVGNAPDLSPLS